MGLGTSTLQAVNQIALAVGRARFTALDSSGSWPTKTYGSSDAGEIEYYLFLSTRETLTKGWEFNKIRMKPYTPSGGEITFGSNILKATPVGPSEHLRIAIRGTKAYDLINDASNTFNNSTTYFFEVVTDHDFDDCPPDVKNHIIAKATEMYQSRKRGDPQLDQKLQKEVIETDFLATRPNIRDTTDRTNMAPLGLRTIGNVSQQQ